MKIVCDNCSTKYSIADEKVRGKVFKIKCKKCSHIIVVKGTEGADAGGAAPAPGPGFDQKETRVFDYSGFEGQGEAVWHLVIDREQVGPMSPAEMKQKMDAGQIDGETYAWKEGMGDWQRIAAIPELTFLVTGGAPPQAPGNEDAGGAQTTIGTSDDAGGGLFGSADQQQQVTGKADPADLFAAAAASSVDDEGGDLFGGRGGGGDFAGGAAPMAAAPAPAARRSVPKEDIFGGGGGGGMAAEAAPARGGGGGGAGMTGQRNENSVLFSLSNLAALASDSPKASSGSSSSSGSMGAASSAAFQSGGGSEGSGLIDIRAMAAVTLGNKGGDPGLPKPASAVDDLPVFSGGGGLSAPSAGVLLPSVASRGSDNKKLIIIVGSVIGVLLIAAVALLVIVLKPAPPVAVAPSTLPAGEEKPAPAPAGEEKKPAEVAPATPPGGAVTPPPAETPGVTPPVGAGEEKKPEEKKPARDDRPSRPSAPREEKKPDPVEPKPVKEPAAAKCDEVSCAIDPSLPCCGKKTGGGGTKTGGGGDSGLPDSLGREDIKSGMATVKGRVAQCNDQYKQAGTVEVKISINGDGAVTSAQTTGKFAGTPTGSCVERAVKAAKFKRWKGPSVSVKYPFQFQ